MLIRLDLQGSPFLGVFSKASEEALVIAPAVPGKFVADAVDALEVPALRLTIGGSTVLGSLMTFNSSGAIVSDMMLDSERQVLEQGGLNVVSLPPPFNAAGNVVLANDHGALVHPGLSAKARERVERALGVPATPGRVAGLSTPGSAAICNNKGALVHPKTTPDEKAVLEEALGVKSMPCTANRGSPYLGAGLVANTKGALIGGSTTGPEMARVEDGLGYLD